MVKMFNSDRLKTLKIDRLPDFLEEDGEIQELEEVNLQPVSKRPRNYESGLDNLTEEQVEDPNFWINL
jgi:hypothetical protein